MQAALELLEALVAEARAGRPAVFCAVVEVSGSAPQVPGAAMLVRSDGSALGTVGGGITEHQVQLAAMEVQPGDRGRLCRFALDSGDAAGEVPICGGRMAVALVPVSGATQAEPYRAVLEALGRGEPGSVSLAVEEQGRRCHYVLHWEPPPVLVVVGAGHVGRAVAQLGAWLDFRLIVLDDRADLLAPEHFPPGVERRCGEVVEQLGRLALDESSYVVIVTRGHRHDQQALLAVIDRPTAYVGMIASRRKAELVRRTLLESGVSAERVARVHTPIGLSIGAVTVPEIAVSIMGEVIRERRRRVPRLVEGPFFEESA